MGYKFTSISVMEFDTKEELEAVVAMMPWGEEDKENLFLTGEYIEIEENELNGEVHEVAHTFKVEEN